MKLFCVFLLFTVICGLNQITAKSVSSKFYDKKASYDLKGDTDDKLNDENLKEINSYFKFKNNIEEKDQFKKKVFKNEIMKEFADDSAVRVFLTMGLASLIYILSEEPKENTIQQINNLILMSNKFRTKRSASTDRWSEGIIYELALHFVQNI